jgi:peroxiredoxin
VKGFVILGCSKDPPELNAIFHAEQDFQFPLLCDSDGALYAHFAVSGRATVVVQNGTVLHTLSPFDARTGPASLLELL